MMLCGAPSSASSGWRYAHEYLIAAADDALAIGGREEQFVRAEGPFLRAGDNRGSGHGRSSLNRHERSGA
jgi:hypothetical protein